MAGIGFFTPLPLALMIPFMFLQSAAMAEAFGFNYQYGKRKISSMTNEEFNALTPTAMNQKIIADTRSLIPSVQQSMVDFRGLQEFIIQEILQYTRTISKEVTDFGSDTVANFIKAHQEAYADFTKHFLPEASATSGDNNQLLPVVTENIPIEGQLQKDTRRPEQLSSSQQRFLAAIRSMSLTRVSAELKLYAQKNLGKNQHPRIGKALLDRYNKLTSQKQDIQTRRDVHIGQEEPKSHTVPAGTKVTETVSVTTHTSSINNNQLQSLLSTARSRAISSIKRAYNTVIPSKRLRLITSSKVKYERRKVKSKLYHFHTKTFNFQVI